MLTTYFISWPYIAYVGYYCTNWSYGAHVRNLTYKLDIYFSNWTQIGHKSDIL